MNKSSNTPKKKLKKRETELKPVSHKLMQDKQELLKTRFELKSLNRELVQSNHTMSMLAKKIEMQKHELEKKVNTTITDKIMPIVRALQTEPQIKKFWPQINSVAQHLKSMNNQDESFHKAIYLLSQTEINIATMIMNGISSKEISNLLNISLETVKTHRKHIRKKLNINNTNYNLSSYLVSVLGND